jgi:hypothetical protein
MKINETMHANNEAESSTSSPEDSGKSDSDKEEKVVDGEFKDIGDNK